jgi:proteasome assembly chaperone (PAC2) family protein
MHNNEQQILTIRDKLALHGGTLVLAFSGWMDGGDVSTGTAERLISLLEARPIAEIDAEPFYIYNFPGTMEIAALFRPHIAIEDGLVTKYELPTNVFYGHEAARLALFVGKEPNLNWRLFGRCILRFAAEMGIRRMLFVGSFGGSVPHTREPRLYVTSSDSAALAKMDQFGTRRTGYEGPGSFSTYLLTQAPAAGIEMTSLVTEVPGYLQGTNPMCIEAVTRRLAKILKLPLNLDELRSASTLWELEVSAAIEKDAAMAARVHKLEQEYDNELLEQNSDER